MPAHTASAAGRRRSPAVAKDRAMAVPSAASRVAAPLSTTGRASRRSRTWGRDRATSRVPRPLAADTSAEGDGLPECAWGDIGEDAICARFREGWPHRPDPVGAQFGVYVPEPGRFTPHRYEVQVAVVDGGVIGDRLPVRAQDPEPEVGLARLGDGLRRCQGVPVLRDLESARRSAAGPACSPCPAWWPCPVWPV